MVGKDRWFTVEGIVVGWLRTNPGGEEPLEDDVAVVQTDDGRSFIRWLGNDWEQIDPPPKALPPIVLRNGEMSEGIEQVAATGTRIRFMTCRREQKDYTRLARGNDPQPT